MWININFYFFTLDRVTGDCQKCSKKCGICKEDTNICVTCKSNSGRSNAPICTCQWG